MSQLVITPAWNLTNAPMLLEASAATYPPNVCELQSDLCHCQVTAGAAVVVAFRGSADVRDWLTDFDAERVKAEEGEVHEGFHEAIKSIAGKLIVSVMAAVHPESVEGGTMTVGDCALFVTGHSLGGAMALLGAQLLRRAGFAIEAVMTFGGPRVGDAAWAADYDARLGGRTWRVVNGEDIVPRVPGWAMGYRHAGQEAFLPSRGGPLFNPGLGRKAWSDLAGTVKGWVGGRIDQLADHKLTAYRARLEAIRA